VTKRTASRSVSIASAGTPARASRSSTASKASARPVAGRSSSTSVRPSRSSPRARRSSRASPACLRRQRDPSTRNCTKPVGPEGPRARPSSHFMLASLSLVFSHEAQSSSVLSQSEQAKVSTQLEKNAAVLPNTYLQELLVGQPADVRKEIIHINPKSRPIALQIALLIPLVASLLGLLNGFRMSRLPDPEPSAAAEGLLAG